MLTGLPSIGVGKTAVIGEYAEVGPERGAWSPLTVRAADHLCREVLASR